MSDSVRPHRQQPTRLPRPWDSPGKNTGVGCHFLLQCMKVKSENKAVQSCLTLRNCMDCSHQAPLPVGFSMQEHWSGTRDGETSESCFQFIRNKVVGSSISYYPLQLRTPVISTGLRESTRENVLSQLPKIMYCIKGIVWLNKG